ncbi:MAG: toprim domain-containing protein, partial [Ktedonobacteraceae bacterium]
MATNRPRRSKTPKKVFPVRSLLLLHQNFHLLSIEGESFLIKGKEHRHVRQSEYAALLELGWIGPACVIAEGMESNEITPEGRRIAIQMEDQNRGYSQLYFDLPEFDEIDELEEAQEIDDAAQGQKEAQEPAYQIDAVTKGQRETQETASQIDDAQGQKEAQEPAPQLDGTQGQKETQEITYQPAAALTPNEELEKFKSEINLAELAAAYGYELVRKESCKTSFVMKHPAEVSKIVVATDSKDGHSIFFDVHNRASGSVVDFVMYQENVNLGYARKILRNYLNGERPAPVQLRRPEATSRDQALLFANWQAMRPYQGSYLEERGLNPETIAAFAEHIRTDRRGNTIFRHDNDKGLSGWEAKNTHFSGFSGAGKKALFIRQIGNLPPDTIVIAESAIDTMSYYQLHPENGLYMSFAGSMSQDQEQLLNRIVTRYQESKVIIVTDRDQKGNEYAQIIHRMRPDAVRATPPIGKDWNETLQHHEQPVEDIA